MRSKSTQPDFNGAILAITNIKRVTIEGNAVPDMATLMKQSN